MASRPLAMAPAVVGIIGGSALGDAFELEDEQAKFLVTPYGAPSDPPRMGKRGEATVVFLPRHGKDHRIPPHKLNHRANLWAMKELGATHILATSSTGSLKKTIHPGTFVVPDDFIGYWDIPTYYDDRVVHATPSLDGVVRAALVTAAIDAKAIGRERVGAIPMSILIRDLQVEGDVTQVYIEGNRIVEIGKKREADTVIDGKGKIALPGFVNLHTHAAMTLFRGWGDDLELSTWLETKIWPAEARLTPDDVYWGTKLASLEMIKTGTTTFNDMYFHMDAAAKAVKEMGLRAFLAEGIVDLNDPERAAKQLQTAEAVNRRIEAMKTDRITPVLGPHAIYSVSKDTLVRIRELADKTGSLIHIHLSETKREVDDCLV